MAAAVASAQYGRVSILWILAVFFLLACGGITLGPVGISSTVDAAPPAYRVRMMGLYWLFVAFGAALGSQVVRLSALLPHEIYYGGLGCCLLLNAVALLLFAGHISRALRSGGPTPARSTSVESP